MLIFFFFYIYRLRLFFENVFFSDEIVCGSGFVEESKFDDIFGEGGGSGDVKFK